LQVGRSEIRCPSMGNAVKEELSVGRIVLFNGPPSTGKTSLVRSLQRAIAEPWFHMSLDVFRSGFSEQCWVNDDGRLFSRVMAAYLASLRQIALTRIDVLAESVITPTRRTLYATAFGETPIVLVGVHCPLEVAIQRESDRTDRQRGPIELAAADFDAVHSELIYDFEVDTSRKSPEDLATEIAPNFNRLSTSSFVSHLS
jgi:chloramphenicol 3-O phosphotransferase